MIKKFTGIDAQQIIKEIDAWMIANNASFYGSKAMRKRVLPNGMQEFIINVKL